MYLSYLLLASDFELLDMIAGHLWKIVHPVIRKARAGPSAKVVLCPLPPRGTTRHTFLLRTNMQMLMIIV